MNRAGKKMQNPMHIHLFITMRLPTTLHTDTNLRWVEIKKYSLVRYQQALFSVSLQVVFVLKQENADSKIKANRIDVNEPF